MIFGFGILSKAHFWPEILRIKVIIKKWEFCLIFWQLSDTKNVKSLTNNPSSLRFDEGGRSKNEENCSIDDDS